MTTLEQILLLPLSEIRQQHPQIIHYLQEYGIPPSQDTLPLGHCLALIAEEVLQEAGSNRQHLLDSLNALLQEKDAQISVDAITIIGGRNKAGKAEAIELTLNKGSITSIVGPTGSGKSRLLGDIEWMAQGDTPTGRRILVNHAAPSAKDRFSLERKLVAQLSQNMNFVMDASVGEFIQMHAESRGRYSASIIDTILTQANRLAGEAFSLHTPLTALSGGQSRALMIADTAFLSTSTVVLVDEIENAGIDRHRALALLANQEKIVLIATHDPLLALMGERRLVIRNGGIHQIIETTEEEKRMLVKLEAVDHRLALLRGQLRAGEKLKTFSFPSYEAS